MKRRKIRALIVGDVMLDRFVYGKTLRISPEAPVPVLSFTDAKSMLGGAGNVLRNVQSLGAEAVLVSVVGDDEPGRTVSGLLKCETRRSKILVDNGRPTTIKTRYISGTNHILRVDNETTLPISSKLQNAVIATFRSELARADIILISDYGKGLLSVDACRKLIQMAKKSGIRIIVDPKGRDYSKYIGASIVKPNLKEFGEVTGLKLDPSAADFEPMVAIAAKKLCTKYDFGGVLITLSEHGMIYVPCGRAPIVRIPAEARDVYDVSGAGDTSLAALGISLAEGSDMMSAMRFSNSAAGVAVSKLGTATVTRDEVVSFGNASDGFSRKILSRESLTRRIEALKREGKQIGFTNGCFDCCHRGHLKSLRDTRALCDVLVVGVNSDAWITAHKGKGRPVQDEATRTELLASLEFVDYVTIFDEETALPLVKALRPQIIAKEGYRLTDWPEGRFVRSIGGKAVVLERIPGYSTTGLVKRMKG